MGTRCPRLPSLPWTDGRNGRFPTISPSILPKSRDSSTPSSTAPLLPGFDPDHSRERVNSASTGDVKINRLFTAAAALAASLVCASLIVQWPFHFHPRKSGAERLFEDEVAAHLAALPPDPQETGTCTFKVSGPNGGIWTVDLGKRRVLRGPVTSSTTTVSISDEDLMAMTKNAALGMQFYFQGRLRVEGDPMLLTKMGRVFSGDDVNSRK